MEKTYFIQYQEADRSVIPATTDSGHRTASEIDRKLYERLESFGVSELPREAQTVLDEAAQNLVDLLGGRVEVRLNRSK